MVLLRVEPARPVSGLRELEDLELALSRQRATLYDDLARRMAEFGNDAAEDAFRRVAEMLRDEGAGAAGGEAAAPTVHQDEDLGSSRLVTPYAAYALAVRNQERAFAFWTYVSAQASDPGVRSEAERLAGSELQRVKSLRAERRQAFHAGRSPGAPAETLRPASLEDLRSRAGEIEASLAAVHERVSAALAEMGDDRAAAISAAATEEREMAERFGAAVSAQPQPIAQEPDALAALAAERLEAAVELYLGAAESARSEDIVSTAQDLADRAIRRLSHLR